MVQRKRDPGSRGGGGAAMVRTALPNYMRATSSSYARAGRAVGREAAASAAPPRKREVVRAEVVFGETPHVSRATCSSTMKGLGLAAAAHVCPYSYCSFKGHVHASVLPLRGLVSSRRRLIKTQQSMKLKGASPFRRTNNGGAGDGFFVEIYAGTTVTATTPTVESDVGCSDLLSTEDMDAAARRVEYAMFDHRSCRDDGDMEKDSDGSVDGSCGSSDMISGGSVELLMAKSRGCKQEIDKAKEIYIDQEAEDFGACKSDISEELDARYEGEVSVSQIVSVNAKSHLNTEILKPLLMDDEQYGNSTDCGGNASNGSSIDDISCAFGGMSFKDVCPDPADEASIRRKKWNIARRTTSDEQGEQMRPFNPRAPNFLPGEHDREAEKVDLRHQMMGDRKNAEEWMVDYALRRAVNKLARVQKRKVEMLVQAFETVLPPVANEKKSVKHDDDDKKSSALSLQPCS